MRLSRSESTPQAGPKDTILRLRAGVKKSVYVCSSSIEWFWVHWEGRRSAPCTEPHEECRGHKLQLPRRCKGYLNVYCLDDRRYCYVELTPTCGEQFDRHYGKGANLRGARFSLQRGQGDKAHLYLEFQEAMSDTRQLKPGTSVERVLRSLWKLSEDVQEEMPMEEVDINGQI